MLTKIWYSVENCGDGSAYPKLMESEELCYLDQRYMDEGWGEDCVGYITIESDAPIIVKDKVITVEQTIDDTKDDLRYYSGKAGERFVKEKLTALLKLKGTKDGKKES